MSQYQLFPDLTETEYADLKADIAERGVMVPVEYDEAGNLLDGHHRVRICEELGVRDFPSCIRYGYTEEEKRLHIRQLNLARRHLTREQRNKVMREMRAEGNTIQDIADATGVGRGTAERATSGVFPNGKTDSATVTGRDGKTYPARKPRDGNGDQPKPSLFTATSDQRDKATEPETASRIASGVVKPQNKINLGGAHVGHNSRENEWNTPQEYIDAARKAMGGIDLDPASTETANAVVCASEFFTEDDDGLSQDWYGRVFMNPPYAQPLVGKFADKLADSVESGHVKQACILVNNATETRWFQRMASVCCAVCFPEGRIRFWHAERESATPLQGQAILYAGHRAKSFRKAFQDFGFIAEIES